MLIRVVTFDCYGTLVDASASTLAATTDILAEHGSSFDPVLVHAKWEAAHRQVIATLDSFVDELAVFVRGLQLVLANLGLDPAHAERDVQHLVRHLGHRPAYAEAAACVTRMADAYTVVVASNSDDAPLRADLDRNLLVIDGAWSSETLRAYKPWRRFYSSLCAEVRCTPTEVLFVGDDLDNDYHAPHQAGMHALWLNRTGKPVPDGVHTIASLNELTPDLVATLTD